MSQKTKQTNKKPLSPSGTSVGYLVTAVRKITITGLSLQAQQQQPAQSCLLVPRAQEAAVSAELGGKARHQRHWDSGLLCSLDLYQEEGHVPRH